MARVVILSTADMKSAVWTNKQHLAVRLAAQHEVSYIESMGLRRPQLARADLKRIAARVSGSRRNRTTSDNAEGVLVVRPLVIPFHDIRLVSWVNGLLLRAQLRRHLGSAPPADSILWTFSPVTYGIDRLFGAVIYHSVDLLHELEGVPKDLLLEQERALVQRTDVVISSSTAVAGHLRSQGADRVRLWENVADTELYASVRTPRADRAVFAGNLTPGKVDFGLLTSIADAGIDVVLAGPIAIDGVKDDDVVGQLLRHEKVTYVGNLKPPQLAVLLNSCTVGVIPYVQNPYTVGVFPMKVYEYLASGLSVVVTPLPSLIDVTNTSVTIARPRDFANEVQKRISPTDAQIAENRDQAEGHSWTSRTLQANSLIQELVPVND